jgi:hypothetical protein
MSIGGAGINNPGDCLLYLIWHDEFTMYVYNVCMFTIHKNISQKSNRKIMHPIWASLLIGWAGEFTLTGKVIVSHLLHPKRNGFVIHTVAFSDPYRSHWVKFWNCMTTFFYSPMHIFGLLQLRLQHSHTIGISDSVSIYWFIEKKHRMFVHQIYGKGISLSCR